MMIKYVFNNMSIKYKIFFAYILLLFLILSAILVANLSLVAKQQEIKTLYTAKQALQQTASFLEYKTVSTKNLLDMTAHNEILQTILKRQYSDYENNVGLWSVDAKQLQKSFFTLSINPDITSIHLYMKNGPASLFKNEDFLLLTDHEKTPWYKTLTASRSTIFWFPSTTFNPLEEEGISVLKWIPNNDKISENIGVLRLDLDTAPFQELLSQALVTTHTKTLLINFRQEVICHSEDSLPIETLQSLSQQLPLLAKNQVHWNQQTLNGNNYYVGAHLINKTDWTLLMLIPHSDISRLLRKNMLQTIIIFLLAIPLALPFIYLISKSITQRIIALIGKIHKVENGDFNISILPSSDDEIGILTRNFNYLLTKVALLLDEKYDLGKEIKNMELKALQAQINPHFLYNTLDQIYWMAQGRNANDISQTVLSLSTFYKLSLSKGSDFVSLQQELDHIKAYVDIQNIRYDHAITLTAELPESLLSLHIPKITLQPIIENAIHHGLLESATEKGTIHISSMTSGNAVIIKITDTGQGMTEDTLSKLLLAPSDSQQHHGYGLYNIDRRLKLNFGDKAGLGFESKLSHGTTVLITFPCDCKINGKLFSFSP